MSKFKRGYGTNQIQADCGPSIKDLKLDLAELKEATKLVLELMEGGYISYDVQDKLLGNLYLRKRNLKKQIKNVKAKKKYVGK